MNDLRCQPRHAPCWRRVLAADLSYPIVLMWKSSRWVILDGYHRLLKADLDRHETIRAVRLPAERAPEILRDDSPLFALLNREGEGRPEALSHLRAVARTVLYSMEDEHRHSQTEV